MKTLLIAVGILVLVNQSLAETGHKWWNVASDTFMGTNYSQEVTSKQGAAFPTWNPELGVCPLGVKEAVRIARLRLSSKFPGITGWELSDIHLYQLDCNADKWAYRINFYVNTGHVSDLLEMNMSIVVALNGWTPNIETVGIREAVGKRVDEFSVQDPEPVIRPTHEFTCVFMGTNYARIVTSKQGAALPSWNPETSVCPLSMKDALRIARSRLASEFPLITGWKLSELSLCPLLDSTDKWAYWICFCTGQEDGLRSHNGMGIAVALNGWTPDIANIDEGERVPANLRGYGGR